MVEEGGTHVGKTGRGVSGDWLFERFGESGRLRFRTKVENFENQ
jgi:hypothetical protein